MIKAVIFDMDGTMFDTERMVLRELIRVGREYGYDISYEVTLEMLGKNFTDAQQVLRDYYGKDLDYAPLRRGSLIGVLDRMKHEGVPFKYGLYELMCALYRAGVPMTVATSSASETAREYFELAGISHFFPKIVGGESVLHGKPDPQIYLLAAETLGVEPGYCAVLEDSRAGIESARRAGMQPILIPDILPSEAICPPEGTPVFDDLHGAREYIFQNIRL